MRLVVTFFVISLLLQILPNKVFAVDSSIVINEFMANPLGSDTLLEWIELYNNSDSTIEIEGWKIDGFALGTYQFEPRTYLILVRDLDSFPGVNNVLKANFSLLNTTDTITIEDNSGSIVHSLSYSNPIDGKSFEYRGPLCEGIDLNSLDSTIGVKNNNYQQNCYFEEIPIDPDPIDNEPENPPLSFPKTLQISELYPSVNTGESEWIEIYNYGFNEINLEKIFFADGKECDSVTQKNFLSGKIGSNNHVVINNPVGISLNDSGDSISLCGEELLSRFIYTESTKGKSFSREFFNDKYLESSTFLTTPTPSQINHIEKLEISTIEQVKNKNANDEVLFEGVLNSPFEALYSNTFFVQDGSMGIKVTYTGESIIEVNNKVRVTGKLKLINKEKVVEATKIELIEEFINLPETFLTSLETQSGVIVFLKGKIVKNFATGFDIETNLGIIRVSVLARTGIDIPERKKGDEAKVSGILTRDSIRFKVLPFEMDSIEIYPQLENSLEQDEYPKDEIPSVSEVLGNDFSAQTPSYYKLNNGELPINPKIPLIISVLSLLLLGIYFIVFRKDILLLFSKFYQEDRFVLPKFPSRA
jgi:hypothetical protein